jgi:Protein of unknown function (DUF3788)
MSEKETFILPDPMVEPTEEFLSAVLGEKFNWWQQIRDYTTGHYPGVTELWRYYNDGKQWLYRLMQKKNTICWIAVMADTFRITFYFGLKATPIIEASALPDSIKADFLTAKMYGKIKAISIKMREAGDVVIVCQLVDLKMKMK